MLRSSLISASAVLLCASSASAQQTLNPTKIVSPVKDAGIYHVSTGTWTRANTSSANLGPDTIYSGEHPSGYYGPIPGQVTDEMILPGTGNPAGGLADEYNVDGFQLGYCSFGFADTTVDLEFFDSYTSCDTPSAPVNGINSVGAFAISGLPNNGCWIVTFDLAGGGEMCFTADGGPVAPGYQGGNLDHAGWSSTWGGTGGTTSAAVGGLIYGYNPNWAAPGEGTCYNTASTCGTHTGLGGLDQMAIDEWTIGGVNPGCYWYGGYINTNGCGQASQNVGGQFYLELYTDCDAGCAAPACGTEYCDTSGAQNGSISIDSCSVTNGSNTLSVSGADPSLTLFAYFNVAAGNGTFSNPPGSVGDLCLVGGGSIGRYNGDLQVLGGSGAYTTDIWNSTTGGGGGGLPSPPGGSIAAGDTWNFQGWQRMGQQQPTTWSTALEVVFTP